MCRYNSAWRVHRGTSDIVAVCTEAEVCVKPLEEAAALPTHTASGTYRHRTTLR